MQSLRGLEDKLNNIFKGLPPLPANTKESLAKIWPWLALIAGVLQLWAAWALYDLIRLADRLGSLFNSLSTYTGTTVGPTSSDKTIIYLGVMVLVVDAIVLLMAYPKLKERLKSGWDLLFLAAVINVVYGVIQMFTYSRGVSGLITSLIGSAVGFYLLFQVRDKFSGKQSATPVSN